MSTNASTVIQIIFHIVFHTVYNTKYSMKYENNDVAESIDPGAEAATAYVDPLAAFRLVKGGWI